MFRPANLFWWISCDLLTNFSTPFPYSHKHLPNPTQPTSRFPFGRFIVCGFAHAQDMTDIFMVRKAFSPSSDELVTLVLHFAIQCKDVLLAWQSILPRGVRCQLLQAIYTHKCLGSSGHGPLTVIVYDCPGFIVGGFQNTMPG